MNVKEIRSPQNSLIRRIVRLMSKSKSRRVEGVCVIEGLREIERAVQSGMIIETILYRPEVTEHTVIEDLFVQDLTRPQEMRALLHVHCNDIVFNKIAYRADVPNAVAIAHRKASVDLEIQSHDLPFLLLLEGVEKPGNLGAILRTADAMGVTGVILVDCAAEFDHPHVIRNSLGAAFSLDIVTMSATQAHRFLNTHQIPLYVTYLHAQARSPECLPLDQPCAIVLGAESSGAHARWIDTFKGEPVLIPMVDQRVVDSLNVSVAAGIIMYEVARQRRLRVSI